MDFILRLVAHDRIFIRDRLVTGLRLVIRLAPLCSTERENISHLYFKCEVSAQLWNKLVPGRVYLDLRTGKKN